MSDVVTVNASHPKFGSVEVDVANDDKPGGVCVGGTVPSSACSQIMDAAKWLVNEPGAVSCTTRGGWTVSK